MNNRIQRVLDGELPRSELSATERAALERAELALARVVSALPKADLPDLAPAVLARTRGPEAEPARPRYRAGLLPWLITPRTLTIRPAWGLAAAAVLAAVVLVRPSPAPPVAAPVAVEGQPAMVLVHFQLEAPGASEVRLAGDFTDWQATHPLSRSESGTWSVVVPLTPGIHEYAFVVDGRDWTPDPLAPAVADGFG
ncbi:MAG TPA: glycogen-binding domain-containing protein, partial [Gemmatimonadales bacterium]|nr:glycogen-binding domain-containing protein [Gemmatimonadales bacterium]